MIMLEGKEITIVTTGGFLFTGGIVEDKSTEIVINGGQVQRSDGSIVVRGKEIHINKDMIVASYYED